MKWTLIFIATLASALVMAQGWKNITSREAGLQFSVPTEPKTSTRTDKEGQYTVQTRMWVASAGNTNFVVSVSFLPKNAPGAFAKNMMEGIKRGFLNSTNASITGEKMLTRGGVSGKQVSFATPSGVKGAVWIASAGSKVYSFTVAKQNGTYNAELNKFLGSVKFTK